MAAYLDENKIRETLSQLKLARMKALQAQGRPTSPCTPPPIEIGLDLALATAALQLHYGIMPGPQRTALVATLRHHFAGLLVLGEEFTVEPQKVA